MTPFITFEGIDGAGKSTLARAIGTMLEEHGKKVLLTREPGAGDFGAQIRKILLEGGDMPPESELFLFLADRSNHVRNIILPALARGKWVLCDRHADSTLVYQGYGRDLDRDFLRQANFVATSGLRPTKTILVDLPVEVAKARQTKGDRLDAESIAFFERVRAGFLAEAELEPDRWVILDGTLEPNHLVKLAWAELARLL
jgi:dTMP kinase